jgi:hypothetical protein
MNKELIMKRLAAGENVEAIAAELTAMLNEANKAYEAEVEAARAEAERKAKEEAERKEIEHEAMGWLKDAVDGIKEYVFLMHPDVEPIPLTVEELREIIEQSLPLLQMGKKVVKHAKFTADEVDEVLKDFLKMFKL